MSFKHRNREIWNQLTGHKAEPEFQASVNGDHEPEEEQQVPFPLHCFPMVAQNVIAEVCRADLVPESLVGCTVLGIASAALGAGIRVKSGALRFTRGNIFVLAIAASGVGKGAASKRVMMPFRQAEDEIVKCWKHDTAPPILAEYAMLEAGRKSLASKAAKTEGNERQGYLDQMAAAERRMDELELIRVQPCLSVADVTKEKLGVIMSGQTGEAVASISSESRGIIDVLCGKYSDGSSDEDFYTAAYSGDAVKVDRISRATIYLRSPCLTVFWMIQPDKVRSMLGKESMTESGILQRFLITDTHAEPQEIDEEEVDVDQSAFDGWDKRIRRLIADYRLRKEPLTIEPSAEAKELLRRYYNELVKRRRTSGDLHDVNSYVARWCEQAWRIAVIWHALNPGKDSSILNAENVGKAIELVKWFSQEQLVVLSAMRSQQRQSRMDKLAEILERYSGDRCKLRDLRRSHGFDESEVQTLAEEYPNRLEILVSAPKTGRPSPMVILKD